MSDKDLKQRIKSIKRDLSVNYNTLGIYGGLPKDKANYAVSKYVLSDTYLSTDVKLKIDEFLLKFGY